MYRVLSTEKLHVVFANIGQLTLFYLHQIKRVNSKPLWQHYKHCHYYYCYCYCCYTFDGSMRDIHTMAKPTSAFFSAGPSLVPSPVTATTSRLALRLLSMMPFTKTYLSFGDDRAITRRLGQISSNCCWRTCMTSSTKTHDYNWAKLIHRTLSL